VRTGEWEKERDEEFIKTASTSYVLHEAAGIRVSIKAEICKTWTLQQWLVHNLPNPITD